LKDQRPFGVPNSNVNLTKDLELQLKERSLVVNSLATRTTDLFQANKWNIQLTQATTGRQRLLTTAMGLLGQGEAFYNPFAFRLHSVCIPFAFRLHSR